MICAEIQRLVRLNELPGRTIAEVKEGFESIRLIFEDERFIDLDTEDDKIIVRGFKPRKRDNRR